MSTAAATTTTTQPSPQQQQTSSAATKTSDEPVTKLKTTKFASKSSSKDDEICDDWEQLDPIQIEKSLQSIKLNNNDEEKIVKNLKQIQPFSFANQNNPNTNQFQPQAIKILKRPASTKKLPEMANQNQTNANTQLIKTFEQREQEYAQARLRIMGSAHPEPEPPANNNSNSNSSTKNNTFPVTNGQSFNSLNQSHISASSGQTNGATKKNDNQSTRGQQQQQQNSAKPVVNLIREPATPDGSRGFQQKNPNNNNNNTTCNSHKNNRDFRTN